MIDAQRLDFLAELMNLSVLRELSPGNLTEEQHAALQARSLAIFNRYELHRRTVDTPTAFRLAVDDAAASR